MSSFEKKKASNRRFFIKFPGEHWNWLTFLQPFSAELWLSLAGLFTTISAFLVASYFCGIEQIVRPSSFLPGPSMLIIWGSWMGQVLVVLVIFFHRIFLSGLLAGPEVVAITDHLLHQLLVRDHDLHGLLRQADLLPLHPQHRPAVFQPPGCPMSNQL